MSEVLQFRAQPGRRNSRRAARMATITQIIEALEKLGGTAHRDRVVEMIASERRLTDSVAVERLRHQVYAVFNENCEPAAPAATSAPLFRQVFGNDSRRWGLSRHAEATLRQGGIDLEALAV